MLVQILIIVGAVLAVLGMALAAIGAFNFRARKDPHGTRISSPIATTGVVFLILGIITVVAGAIIANL